VIGLSDWTAPKPFDDRIWVGKNISLAQVKAATACVLIILAPALSLDLEPNIALECPRCHATIQIHPEHEASSHGLCHPCCSTILDVVRLAFMRELETS
jgi:hypothetical protein